MYIKLATWKGLEPSTSSVTGWHSNQLNYQAANGGTNRARTCDPLLVRQVLSQLSYSPGNWWPIGESNPCYRRERAVSWPLDQWASTWLRATLPGGRPPSTIAAKELNFCVRDGNRWTLITINTNSYGWDITHLLYVKERLLSNSIEIIAPTNSLVNTFLIFFSKLILWKLHII